MILVTAATRWEANPLIRQWKLAQDTSGCFRGKLGTCEVLLLRSGVGPAKTFAALERLKDIPFDSSAIAISSGFAGALQPDMHPGEIAADLREAPMEFVEATRRAAKERGIPLHLGAFRSTDTVLNDPAEKKALGARCRAVAVDMESATVREWCRSRGGTFLAIRAILDAVGDRLPNPPPKDGDASVSEWTRYVIRERRYLPLMIRLSFRQRRAMSALTRFLDGLIKELQTKNEP